MATFVVEDSEEKRLLMGHGSPNRTSSIVTMDMDSCSIQSSSRAEEDLPTDISDEVATEQLHELRYNELLRRSYEEDLSSIEETNCVYKAGFDKHGRTVIVFIGKWFKQSEISLDKALLYLIRLVHDVADHDYVVVYFHTRTSRDNIPSYWWIKEVYNTVTYKYKKHLKAFYIVHPTMWTKMTCWWFSTFMAPAIKNKIQNIPALEMLSSFVDQKEMSLPMFITEQDMVFNGIRYYKP